VQRVKDPRHAAAATRRCRSSRSPPPPPTSGWPTPSGGSSGSP